MERQMRRRPALGFALLLAVFGPPGTTRAASYPAGEALSLLEVYVNQWAVGGAVPVILDPEGEVWLRASDLRAWRVRLAGAPGLERRGEVFVLLGEVPGLSYRVDERRQALRLTVPPRSMETTRIAAQESPGTPPSPAGLGGFLNYELLARTARGDEELRGLWETGFFRGRGSATSSFLAGDGGSGPGVLRLETAWTRADPDSMTRWRLGDGVSRGGGWWRAVRFAGIAWETDFRTRPGFIPFPLPAVSGEAALPSVVDLYVDEARRWRREVPPGPFEISDLPVFNGRGEMQLVVRDLLGREQRITDRFHVSDALLRPGLSDFSYGFGLVRRGFGLASDSYGEPLATFTHRRGLTPRFTGEVHGEFVEDQGAIGVGAARLFEGAGVLRASLAASGGEEGWGGLAGLGFSRQGRRTSFEARVQVADSGFRTPSGALAGALGDPRLEIQGRWSLSLDRRGQISLAVLRRELGDGRTSELASLSYHARPFPGTALGLSAFDSRDRAPGQGGSSRRGAIVTFTRSLGSRTDVSATLASGGGRGGRGTVTLRRSPPAGRGLGYRLSVEGGETERVQGGLEARLDRAQVTLEADRLGGRSAYRLSLRGGLAAAGGRLFLSRPIERSFGVIRVGDYPGVRVYHQNRLVARTGPRGRALVPDLLPFQRNSIGVALEDLPLEVEPGAREVVVSPPGRSGLVVDFPLRVVHGALLEVVLADGRPLPPGSTVRVEGGDEEFLVGRGGAVYVTGLERSGRLEARWAGGECTFTLERPTGGPVTRLGPVVCDGGER